VTSGAKVVLAMLAGVAAVAVFVVAAFLLTDTANLRCVEGELQDNRVAPDGTMYPRVESFVTIEEAEAFVCRRLPYPRDLDGLSLTTVRVARERNLAKTIEGEGGVFMEYEYALGGEPAVLRLGVNFPPPRSLPGREGDALSIQDQKGVISEATSQTGIQSLNVAWIKGGFYFDATAHIGPDFGRERLVKILESVR